MGTIVQDLRFGARLLARTPGFTAVAVLTLGLGVSATTTILGWMNATMLDPVPGVARTSDLVAMMRGDYTNNPFPPLSAPDFLDLRRDAAGLDEMLAYHDDTVFYTGLRVPERGYGAVVTANYFSFLGVTPILGRGFAPGEDAVIDRAPVAVIAEHFWRSHFEGSPRVIGRVLEVNRRPYTIVGVAPRGFIGTKTGVRVDVWMPISMDRAVFGSTRIERRDSVWLNVVGRLAPGADRRAVESALNVRMADLVRRYPDDHKGPTALSLLPLWRSPFGANGYLAASLPILLAIGSVVLLLACANVANLLLVRSVGRRRELAIRVSIGASRWRVVRQALTESLVLGALGGVVAAVLTAWTAESLALFIPPSNVPILLNGRLDFRLLCATVGIALVTSAVCGVLPALRASGLDPGTALKEEAGSVSASLRRARVLTSLVVAQVALSAVLLVCAGLLVRSLRNAERSNPGFDPKGVALVSIDPAAAGYTREQSHDVQRRLVRALAELPGATAVTVADWVPLTLSGASERLLPEGYLPRLHESMDVRTAYVGPAYAATMKIALAEGREFADRDADGVPRVCVVDRAFVDRYWPGERGVGKRLQRGKDWVEVVGVARPIKHQDFSEADEPMVWLPLLQSSRGDLTLHVRTSGDAERLLPALQKVVRAVDPRLPVYDASTLERRVKLGSLFERLAGTFVGSFGLVALALAAVGMYGVLAYSTRQRTREIGIRLALGATPSQVFALVLRQAGLLSGIGLAIGLLAASGTTRFLRSMLVGVDDTDPLTFIAVAVILALVSLCACALPALRAARVRPLRALRHE